MKESAAGVKPRTVAAGMLAIGLVLGATSWSSASQADDLPPLPAGPPTAPSAAASTTSDAIYLRNGGVVRGTLIEAVPDRPVRIQLVTGEIYTAAWKDVDHVMAASSAGTTVAGAGRSVEGSSPPVPSGPMTTLHVDSPRNVEIQGHPRDSEEWITVCTGPCDKPVPIAWEYQVRGADVKASRVFTLQASPGTATSVRVDPGSRSALTLGVVSVCVGGPVALVGLIVAAVGAKGSYEETRNGVTTTQQVGPATLPVGLGILGVGVAAVVAGGIVAVDNASTTVTPSGGAPSAATAAPLPAWPPVASAGPRLPEVPTTTLVDVRF